MPETSEYGPAPEDMEDVGTIEEKMEKVRAACGNASSSPENESKLDSILEVAESNYEKDPDEWNSLLDKMEKELAEMDEDEDISQALDRFQISANRLTKPN